MPDVTMVHRRGQAVTVYEGCLLWAADEGEPVRIVQVDEGVAFQLSSRGILQRGRAPASGIEAGMEGHARAVEWLHRLAIESDEAPLCVPGHLRSAREGK